MRSLQAVCPRACQRYGVSPCNWHCRQVSSEADMVLLRVHCGCRWDSVKWWVHLSVQTSCSVDESVLSGELFAGEVACPIDLDVWPFWYIRLLSSGVMRSSLFTNCDDCLYLSYVSFIQPDHVVYVHITGPRRSETQIVLVKEAWTIHSHLFPKPFRPYSAITHLDCLLVLYWTRLTLLNGFSFLVFSSFFYFGSCGRLSWLKCQLSSTR